MFVGHYAPAAALKSLSAKTPLWHFFIAVQFLDYLWAAFILTGVEKARVVPGFLAASDLDLYFMPWTHSLAAAAAWSFAAAIAYRFAVNAAAGWRGAALIGAAIFSHWLADLIVHAKDLALYPGSSEKLGLGLWSSTLVSQSLEFALTAAGLLVYAAATRPKGAMGRISLGTVFVALIAMQAYNLLAPPPENAEAVAVSALLAYTALAALAFWLDRTRTLAAR